MPLVVRGTFPELAFFASFLASEALVPEALAPEVSFRSLLCEPLMAEDCTKPGSCQSCKEYPWLLPSISSQQAGVLLSAIPGRSKASAFLNCVRAKQGAVL